MAGFDLARLYGGRTQIHFDSSDPDAPIIAWCHYPTPEESAQAFQHAGLTLDDDGRIEYPSNNRFEIAPAMARAHVELACLCIDDVENLDDWPSVCTEIAPSGLTRLTAAAISLLPRLAMRKIGEQMWELSQVSEEEGND